MATYNDLYSLVGASSSESLRQKILVALCVKANAISKLATQSTPQKDFAKSALANPEQYLAPVFSYILAEYKGVAVSSITGATDVQVQAAVDSTVDTLLGV